MATAVWRGNIETLRPMLATLDTAPLQDARLAYEPKYDGIRALVDITPGSPTPVRIWSRLGNDKTPEFPDLVKALTRYARKLKGPVVLDGEIVALDDAGKPAGFQQLQNRRGPVAFIAFDILRDRREDLRSLPLTSRRARLDRVFRNTGSPLLRTSEIVVGDGRALYRRALEHGWEGLVVKDVESIYHTGKRTRDWRKFKIVHQEEFVVCGWTESQASGRPFGALLLGYPDGDGLIYAGHTGSGFDGRELERVFQLLKPLETTTSPFGSRPRTNGRPHWVRPTLVAQVKFTEWTDEGLLRHPIYLGLRDDVVAGATGARGARGARSLQPARGAQWGGGPALTKTRGGATPSASERGWGPASTKKGAGELQGVLDQIEEIERGPDAGRLRLPDGQTLDVGNLRKVFWPTLTITKGELMRYYVRVSPFILPVVSERPLIMKRFPNGIEGKAFYQQRAPETVPPGVRTATIPGDTDVPSRIIGGSLITLLYMTQLAAVSQDPWFSRVRAPHTADQCAIDLDPMPGVKFARVLDVARWVRDELLALNVPCFPKTSGASGIHIYIPLRKGTPYEAGRIFCKIVATVVAGKHPKLATIERAVRARGQTIYVDYLQNIEGKSLACAYSARASEFAGASTPLAWKEVDEGIDPRDFTIRTLPNRLATIGDLWAPSLASKGIDLRQFAR